MTKNVLIDETLQDFFEPVLNSDIKVVEEYLLKKAGITVPIDLFYGNQEVDDESDYHAWNV